ncbi:unnamed protein product, partial [Adineta ricciae]
GVVTSGTRRQSSRASCLVGTRRIRQTRCWKMVNYYGNGGRRFLGGSGYRGSGVGKSAVFVGNLIGSILQNLSIGS